MVSDMTTAAAGDGRYAVPTWTFADRIRKVRRDVLELEQTEIAEKLGITKAAYAAWESGRNEPRSILSVARQLELMAGVPAAWILGVDSGPGGGGAVTGSETNRYHGASTFRDRHLTLVTGLTGRNRGVPLSDPYTSTHPPTESAKRAHRTGPNAHRSARGVNHADAA